jgi:hypothetical protein
MFRTLYSDAVVCCFGSFPLACSEATSSPCTHFSQFACLFLAMALLLWLQLLLQGSSKQQNGTPLPEQTFAESG